MKAARRRSLVGFHLAVALGLTGVVAAADFTVGPTGDYARVQEAIDAAGAMPGELHRILIAQGTYLGCVDITGGMRLILSGGWNEDYTVQTTNPTRTTIDADGLSRSVTVRTGSATDWRPIGPVELHVENLRLRNGWVRGCPPPGVEGCCVRNPGVSVQAMLADVQLRMEDVVVEDGHGVGALVYLSASGANLSASLDRVVLQRGEEGLWVSAKDYPNEDGVDENGTATVNVLNSLIADTGWGVRVHEFGEENVLDMTVVGSTITRNGRVLEDPNRRCGPVTAGVEVSLEGAHSGAGDVRFYNSIIRGNTVTFEGTCVYVYPPERERSVDLLYAIGTVPLDSLDLVSNNLGEIADVGPIYHPHSSTGVATLIDNINEDPLFVDPLGVGPDSFRLAPGSPMIDRGTRAIPDPPGLSSTDLAGTSRVIGLEPDLGAFEWGTFAGRWWLRGHIDARRYVFPPELVIEGSPFFRPEDPWSLDAGCKAGDPADCLQLGDQYRLGFGVPRDPALAVPRYVAACDGQIGAGCFEAAVLLTRGEKPDVQRALELWKKAASLYEDGAAQGRPDAMDGLAMLYSAGWGVPQRDPQHAGKLWAQAAAVRSDLCAEGDAAACSDLGVMRSFGRGVDRDVKKAAALYQTACEKGGYLGCFNLGWVLQAGEGVAQNLDLAVQSYAQACAHDVPIACDFVKRLGKQ